ncbi:MAG: hypothetical protein RL274_1629 [Pseudomonadota bacterium]|jgi:uncharacterized protein involved in outer membrane biogenesis
MSVTEHFQKTRLKTAFAGARRRVIADFRDFRFTWNGFFKWSGITLLAFLVATLVTLYFLDWNQMRGPLSRYLSERTGREVRIDGNLGVTLFTLQPIIDVGGLYIGNPSWVGRPQAARVNHARVELRLLPLLFGNLILPLVKLDQPDLLVVRDATRRTNWDSGGLNPNRSWHLPPIKRFLVTDGKVVIEDAVRNIRFSGSVSSEETRDGGRAAFSLTGNGTLNKNKFLADVKGGPLINVDASKPYPFTADVRVGQTHVVANGTITQPFHLDRFNASMNISGPTLSDLYFMTGLVLPRTPTYRLTLAFVREGEFYRLNDIKGMLGSTDIAGNLSIDASGEIPALGGKLASRVLQFEDLGAVIGAGKNAPAPTRYLLPETVLHTERLRQTNVEVDYSASAIRSRDFPLTSLDTHISLQGGVLNLKPLAFGFTQGKLSGWLKIDARKDVPVTSLDARITGVRAENFIKGTDKPIQGVLEARMILTGSGNSVHAAASTADGTLTAVVPSGGMRHSLAQWTGIDVLTALSLNLSGDNSNTRLRCAVASFGAKNGVLTSQRFIIDTNPVRIDGGGTINLRNETLNMQIQGKPKNFQLVRLRAPITLTGSLANPVLGVDAGKVVAQGGLAAALAFLSPLASIFAFIDPGLAKDANCGPLLADAKAKGAPVKASAVRNAAIPRK